MQEAKMKWDNIDKILLIGGMTRMPMVREMIRRLGLPRHSSATEPDEAVAVGAAI